MKKPRPFGDCVICGRARRTINGPTCGKKTCSSEVYRRRQRGMLPPTGSATCAHCGDPNPRPRSQACSKNCGMALYRRRYDGLTRADYLELFAEGLVEPVTA